MKPEVRSILDRVRQICDFDYVAFDDINDTNSFGSNALHCLAVWGDTEAARTLILEGINVNQHGENGYTPLHEAAGFGHFDFGIHAKTTTRRISKAQTSPLATPQKQD